MTFKSAFIKNSLLVAGLGLSLGLSQSSKATTSVQLVAGGSSGLLGNFTPNGTNNVAEGALPRAIGQLGTITGYNPGGVTEKIFVLAAPAGAVTLTRSTTNSTGSALSGTTTENPTDIEIRVADQGSGAVNVLILVRSDSGFGVRYIANNAGITSLPTDATKYRVVTDEGAGTTVAATSSDFSFSGSTNVLSDLTGSSGTGATGGIAIDSGLSDVAADTVVRYTSASFGTTGTNGIFFSNLNQSTISFTTTPIQTLLLAYNKNVYGLTSPFAVNLTRSQMRGLIAGYPDPAGDTLTWNELDSRLDSTLFVSAAYREITSGTRLTELTNIQRYAVTTGSVLTENVGGFVTTPGSDTNANDFQHALGITGVKNDPGGSGSTISGTGDVLTAVDSGYRATASGSFSPGAVLGYAFVTGTAGNSRTNTRVALFNGVGAYTTAPGTGGDISLPNNNSQAAYSNSASSYYTEVVNGRYELWSYSRAIFNSNLGRAKTTFDAIFGVLNSSNASIAGIVHINGLTQLRDMKATRSSAKGIFVTGENVSDGLFVNLDTTNAVNFPNVLD